jgi:VWFA-related protein
MMHAFVSIAAAAGLCAVSLHARPEPGRGGQTFRSKVETIVMDVSVLDRKGEPVRNLTVDDFSVVEESKPLRITTFEPVQLPDSTSAASGTRSADAQPTVDGRIVVIFLDDATPSPAGEEDRAKEIATRVIDSLGPRDVAGVIFATGRSGLQALTDDRVVLRTAVARYRQRVGQWTVSDPNDPYSRLTRGGFDQFDRGATALYRTTLQSLRRLTQRLAVVPNCRKGIVLISAGIPMTPQDPRNHPTEDPAGAADSVMTDFRELLRAAQRAQVTLYPVDPGGLRLTSPAGDDLTRISAEAAAPRVSAAGLANHAFLRSLSLNTGGFATLNNNDTDAAARGILQDLTAYYLIGFEASEASREYRSVAVRVNRPGVTVRARPGYWMDGRR